MGGEVGTASVDADIFDDLVAERGGLVAEGELPGIAVEILSAQAGDLAAAESAQGDRREAPQEFAPDPILRNAAE